MISDLLEMSVIPDSNEMQANIGLYLVKTIQPAAFGFTQNYSAFTQSIGKSN